MRFYRVSNSLEDLCLNIVVANLGNLYSQCELGERYNNFLRKRYSDRIYSILKKNGQLDEKLVDWLISPYWDNITVGKKHSISNLIPKFAIYGKEITSVSFENSLIIMELLSAVICLLPHVKSLNLNGTSCTDDILSLIRKMCPELKSLSLCECNITDRGMKNLCYVNGIKVGFDSLKVLNIQPTNITPKGLAYIFKNLNLHVLSYPNVATILYYFYLSSNVSKIYDLKELDFSSKQFLPTTSFNSVLEVWTAICPNVEKLSVVDWLSECNFNMCLNFQNLRSLSFTELPYLGIPVPVSGNLAYFLEMGGEKLTEIILQNVSLSVEVIGRTCLNLQKLTLNNINYQDFNETLVSDKVHHLTSLVKLAIKNSCMHQWCTNKSIRFLLRISKNIESVSFHCVRNLSDILVDRLLTMQHLVKAKFVFTDIKDTTAFKLFTSESIQRLYFDGCPYVHVDKCVDNFCSSVRNNVGNTISWQIEYDVHIT